MATNITEQDNSTDTQNAFPRPPLIALAAGGSGGHLFPASSLARNLLGKGYRVLMLTDDRGMRYMDKVPDIPHIEISAERIHKHPIRIFKTVWRNLVGYWQSGAQFRKDKPDVMVGFGGYPSFPAVYAAHKINIPIVLHEQNSILGRANRVLARYANTLALSFSETKKVKSYPSLEMQVTGNPVRQDIIGIGTQDFIAPNIQDGEKFHILVVGGSQGSRILSDVIPEALTQLPLSLQKHIYITQQCREEDIGRVMQAYEDAPLKFRLETFIKDMPAQIKNAHLIITRSGASTIAEMMVAGRPAIYVPLAASLDGDQAQNANYVVSKGGGWLMPEKTFTSENLRVKLEELINDTDQLVQAAHRVNHLGHRDASEKLSELVTRFLTDSRADKVLTDNNNYDIVIKQSKEE